MTPTTPFSTLARAMAYGSRPRDLLPELHRELLAATDGSRSVVLEATRPGVYVATSGRGFAGFDALSVEGSEASRLADLAARGPRLIDVTGLPVLARDLDSQRALLVPVTLVRRPTVLIVARPRVPEGEAIEAAVRAAVEFGIALEWARLARDSAFHHRLRDVSLVFSRGITSSAGLVPALDLFAHEANELLGTRRTSVWLHDRRARELVLTASSDPAHGATAARVALDGDAEPARGLRLDRPDVVDSGMDTAIVVPLRGWRRALGTLIVEGDTSILDREHLVELTNELARQISAGVENVQLVEEVIRQRRLLEDTFNSLADLVIVTDRSRRIVQMNDALLRRLGRTRTEIFERDLAEIAGAEVSGWVQMSDGADSEAQRPPPEDPVRTRVFDIAEARGRFSVTVTPLVNEDDVRSGFVLVAQDVTVQSRLETEREALRARLAQSEKLAALGQFVAGIAHEMNNPLQGILGHLELLLDHSEAARPVQRELRRIYQEADRASRIVRNLLVFSGSRRMARRKLRIDRVIKRVLASRRSALARAGIEVVHNTRTSLPIVTGDPLLLQQAFLNILINAEHAIESSGADGRIEITTTGSSGEVVTTIHDSGAGIPPDALPRIFDPFFTTKDVGKGTGLGLAITYGIVQDHGGRIEAANAPTGGAVITVALPAQPTNAGDRLPGE